MSDRVSPFANGSEHDCWRSRNCDRCSKAYDEVKREFKCDLERALGEGALDDGTISAEIAARFGPMIEGIWLPDCPERSVP